MATLPLNKSLKKWLQRFLLLGAICVLGVLWWRSSHPGSWKAASRKETAKSARNPSMAPKPLPAAKAHSSTVLPPVAPVVLDTPDEPFRAVTTPLPTPPAPEPPFKPGHLRTNGQPTAFEIQVALARRGFSPGPLDGRFGSQTQAAIRAFQAAHDLPETGIADQNTCRQLEFDVNTAVATYQVTSNDLARLRPLGNTWLSKAAQDRLEYENVLELVAEKAWSHPEFIRRLNPALNWSAVAPGTRVAVPSIEPIAFKEKAALVRISLSQKTLQAFGSRGNLLAHFPCSIAERMEKRPVGVLHVRNLAPNPFYLFDPSNYPNSPEARTLTDKLKIPPGPNNPVGTVWIGLNKSGYGIHGTPKPEDVGRTGSLGCFRLANWNAETLMKLAWIDMPVHVEP